MHDRKLNILSLVSYKFLPARLGGDYGNLYFQNYLSDKSNLYVVGSDSNSPANDEIRFHLIQLFRAAYTPYIPFRYMSNLNEIINKRNINIFICSHPYMGLTSYILSKWNNIPLILHSHNIESIRFKTLGKWWWWVLYLYEMWVMHMSKEVLFVTQEDAEWAIKNYKINKDKCVITPFGTILHKPPIYDNSTAIEFRKKYGISLSDKLLYFAGAYNYRPNDQAVIDIVDEIYPRLRHIRDDFKIVIVGKGLHHDIIEKMEATNGKIVYLGFVDNITSVLNAADLMLNPVLTGGGIKTKAVEAIANNIPVVSTVHGAAGLLPSACQAMLHISQDRDWEGMVENIHKALNHREHTPAAFYEEYYWGNTIDRVIKSFQSL